MAGAKQSGQVTVNGNTRVSKAATLAELLEELAVNESAVVAEVNGRIVPQQEFAACPVRDGDCIELVQFVGGG